MGYHGLNTYSTKYNNNDLVGVIDSWFNDFGGLFKTIGSDTYGDKVKTDSDNYTVSMQVAGISKDKLSIQADDDELYVLEEEKVIRSIDLKGLVDIDKISTNLDLGVLTITLPKKESKKFKKIKIK